MVYKSISGLIRAPFTTLNQLGDVIYVGDNAGGISSWAYNSKKKTFDFSDNTRGITPFLENNPALHS